MPELFLIPSTRWTSPDELFADRDYEALRSPPEYGINLSKKGIKALEPFRFDQTLEGIFGVDVAATAGR